MLLAKRFSISDWMFGKGGATCSSIGKVLLSGVPRNSSNRFPIKAADSKSTRGLGSTKPQLHKANRDEFECIPSAVFTQAESDRHQCFAQLLKPDLLKPGVWSRPCCLLTSTLLTQVHLNFNQRLHNLGLLCQSFAPSFE